MNRSYLPTRSINRPVKDKSVTGKPKAMRHRIIVGVTV